MFNEIKELKLNKTDHENDCVNNQNEIEKLNQIIQYKNNLINEIQKNNITMS